uniref:RWD domain-containing protein 4-like n=1 Tax=Saccoglossus kowalevskii TaxID=10224 RepID=A0ABM0MDI5_SACKO|nr:PREDICTED: RWD domain-containing protein 4-like [Saccoglossus kowalevskii]
MSCKEQQEEEQEVLSSIYEGDDCFKQINETTYHSSDVKSTIIERLCEEAEQYLGCAMTYSIFEWAKENSADLMAEQKEAALSKTDSDNVTSNTTLQQPEKKKERKEQLTKAQKRKITNRTDHKGELARGWNWVDVIKHLSKTGGKPDDS